jgi:glycerol-3-phosphate cytidylyltransferase
MIKIFTAMCADLFHVGHLNLLKRAKSLGDVLIVGIPSDYAIEVEPKKTIKNVMDSENRLRIVQAVKEVDFAFVYAENCDLARSIEIIHPDIICRADDWHDFPGKDRAVELGIKIEYLPYTKGISSTDIKEKIKEIYG